MTFLHDIDCLAMTNRVAVVCPRGTSTGLFNVLGRVAHMLVPFAAFMVLIYVHILSKVDVTI